MTDGVTETPAGETEPGASGIADDAGGSTDDLQYLSAIDLAAELAAGNVSAVEALDAAVARVEARNPTVNIVVTLDVERARQRAAEIDGARTDPGRASTLGPLAGVPITIKDSLMVEGTRTTSGAPELSDFVADVDAVSVTKLKDAGAIVYGKTNLPLYAGDVQTFNEVFGRTNNPWDLARTVGGSSGGSAGSLAAGFTSMEIGSDIAGSIRNPAAMCGVVGHKPSYGIVSGRGQIPGPPGTLTQADIAVIGPMARTVDDCTLGLSLMAGPDDWHAPAWNLTIPPPRRSDPTGLRVAVMATDPYCPVDPEIEQAITDTARELADQGATVDLAARPDGFDFAKADRTFLTLLGGAMCGGYSRAEIEEMAERVRQSEGGVIPGELGIEGATIRHREWLTANERRLQMRARWREFFTRWDVLLAPISPTVAIPHDPSLPMSAREIDVAGTTRAYTDQMQWMGLFGAVYLPATAVPIGLHSSGLPMALQVAGPFLEDNTCLAVAKMIETNRGGFTRPPGW
ncbi:MAG: amidase [Actinomycetota bacterium]